MLQKYIKKLFSDLHSAIVGIIVIAAIAGAGSIYIFFQNLWQALSETMKSPTPLWATESLVILLLVYICLKIKKHHSCQKNIDVSIVKFGQFSWKINFVDNKPIVEENPYCKKHNVKLMLTQSGYLCPICGPKETISNIDNDSLLIYRQSVQNLVEAKTSNHLKI